MKTSSSAMAESPREALFVFD